MGMKSVNMGDCSDSEGMTYSYSQRDPSYTQSDPQESGDPPYNRKPSVILRSSSQSQELGSFHCTVSP